MYVISKLAYSRDSEIRQKVPRCQHIVGLLFMAKSATGSVEKMPKIRRF